MRSWRWCRWKPARSSAACSAARKASSPSSRGSRSPRRRSCWRGDRRVPDMPPIELLAPLAGVAENAVPLAKRVPTLEGRVVGLLNNSKAGTRPFLDRVEELLRSAHGVSRIIRYDKRAAIVEITTATGAYASEAADGHSADRGRRAAAAVVERITVADDPEVIFERFTSEGWTDGLPIVPPTEERVAQMLAFSALDPSLSLGPMPPRWGEATITTLAVNGVMAGCKPEYFPVIVTAVKAILGKPFNLYGIQGTTNPASPVLIVNGPIAREIGLNARGNLFGPGFRANATIGRAIRLIMTTIGGGVPQQADKSTLGNPAKYTCCFAENEVDSPWAPLHVERGFEAE